MVKLGCTSKNIHHWLRVEICDEYAPGCCDASRANMTIFPGHGTITSRVQMTAIWTETVSWLFISCRSSGFSLLYDIK